MKKLMYALIFILLFTATSCSVNTKPNPNGTVSEEKNPDSSKETVVDKLFINDIFTIQRFK